VNDVARTAILAAHNDAAIGHAYNVANYPPVTQIEFVEMLGRVASKAVHLVHVPRAQIEQAGGGLFAPPFYFGVYLDLPPITVRVDRVRAELGLEPTLLEDGLRETFRWYERQPRPQPDYSWEDRLLAAARS
jgi:nucleoside-diphosphate-sugar epimerase